MRVFGRGIGVLAAVVICGCEASSGSGLTVGTANGTIGEWIEASSMPKPRANHCAVVSGDRVLVIGGNYKPEGSDEFESIDEVHIATIREDGTLGDWDLAGLLPSGVSACTAAADDKRVYVMGGLWTTTGHEDTIWAAALSENGQLSTFAAIGDLPEGATILSSEAYALPEELVLFDTELTNEGNETFVLRAPLTTTVGDFERQVLVPHFLGYPQFAFDGTHAIVAGGYLGPDDSNAVVNDVVAAAEGEAPKSAASLPEPRAFGRAFAVDGHLYLIGGKDALFGAGQDGTYSSALDGDGRALDWTTQRPLPDGRTNFATAVVGNHVLVLGGGSSGPGLDTVFSARVRW